MTEVLDDVIDPWLARRWWHALMANAVRLVEDAALLATRGSCGRAQALAVLSAEELERAHHLYSAAEREWSKPIEFYSALDGPSEPIAVPDEAYPTDEPVWPRHRAVDLYAEGVVELWDLYRPGVHSCPDNSCRHPEACDRDAKKRAGFIVQRAARVITSPLDISDGDIEVVITLVARGIEWHLAQDRARQKCAVPGALMDSTSDLYRVVLAYAWPDVYDEATIEMD